MVERIANLARARELGLSEGCVGKAYDAELEKIVGYAGGEVFDTEALKLLVHGLHVFQLTVSTGRSEEYTIPVNARSLSDCLIALGINCEYECEFGDFSSVLQLLRETPELVRIRRLISEDVEPWVVASTLDELK